MRVRSRSRRSEFTEHVKLTSHAKLLEQAQTGVRKLSTNYAEREADRVMALIDQDTEFFQERVHDQSRRPC